jgi:hypothetical protein
MHRRACIDGRGCNLSQLRHAHGLLAQSDVSITPHATFVAKEMVYDEYAPATHPSSRTVSAL